MRVHRTKPHVFGHGLVALALLLLPALPAHGRPAHLKTLAEYYGPYLGAGLNNCSGVVSAAQGPHDHPLAYDYNSALQWVRETDPERASGLLATGELLALARH